ncbi:MAG: hypothetical protein AAF961_13475 [Planctomycetota bacterium]
MEIDIRGTEMLGAPTTWTFSGSGVVTLDGILNDGDVPGWTVDNVFLGNMALEFPVLSGSATIFNVTEGTSAPITGVVPDRTALRIGFDVGSPFSYSSGDTIRWSGAVTAAVTLNALKGQGLPYQSLDNIAFSSGGGTGFPAADIVIATVPEPSAIVYGGALAALIVPARIGWKLRRRSALGQTRRC